ncbi:uncharacterized protein A4U43_C01F33600 [Asparagus officinalis]|uniref:Uncharacterized protein n=1 Tax=Asparagus officinalis TaxID=4686 RepID=A0A5P1FWU8_ASPOF|nr:uncharacterized protein A4U43_C01F33600 [Asparagus officinalis]
MFQTDGRDAESAHSQTVLKRPSDSNVRFLTERQRDGNPPPTGIFAAATRECSGVQSPICPLDMAMEVVNGVEAIRNGGLEEGPVALELSSKVNGENEVIPSITEALQANNGVPEDPSFKTEAHTTSGVETEGATAVAPESKGSAFLKKSESSKAQKDGAGQNGVSGIRKNPRAGLSQSLSFPAKGSLASALRKSPVTVKQAKGDTNNLMNGTGTTNGGNSARKNVVAGKPMSYLHY